MTLVLLGVALTIFLFSLLSRRCFDWSVAVLMASLSVNFVGADAYVFLTPVLWVVGVARGYFNLRALSVPGWFLGAAAGFVAAFYVSNLVGDPEWSWVGSFTVNLLLGGVCSGLYM